MPKHEQMGQRLQAAIDRSKVSRAELATRLGISLPYIARMVSGDRSGSDYLQKIAEILGVDERWLRFGDIDVAPDWAKVSPDLLAKLKGMTEQVRTSKSKPRSSVRELLEAMLAEQRAIRQALDRIAKQSLDPVDVPPRRQAVIPRHAADADLAAVASTRSDAEP